MTTTTISAEAQKYIIDRLMENFFSIVDDFVLEQGIDNDEEREALHTLLQEQTIVSVKTPEINWYT